MILLVTGACFRHSWEEQEIGLNPYGSLSAQDILQFYDYPCLWLSGDI